MTCPQCAIAETEIRSPLFKSNCDNCAARLLAQGLAAWRAINARTGVDLQSEIEKIWGVERYAEGRRAVWGWMQRLDIGKTV